MKLVVISDTHMPKKGKSLPRRLIEALKSADFILHAGDWTSIDVVLLLKEFAPVIGVSGNVDSDEIRSVFGERKMVILNGKRIGLVHGHLGKGKTTPERARNSFQNEKVDLIIFGHSHIPYKEKHGDILLFNPGSPTDKRFQQEYSFGIIELNEEINARHIYFKDPT